MLDFPDGCVVDVIVVKSWVNLGGEGSDWGCWWSEFEAWESCCWDSCCWDSCCCACCWIEADAEAEPAAMAACRRREEREPRLATDGRGEGEWRVCCWAAEEGGREKGPVEVDAESVIVNYCRCKR